MKLDQFIEVMRDVTGQSYESLINLHSAIMSNLKRNTMTWEELQRKFDEIEDKQEKLQFAQDFIGNHHLTGLLSFLYRKDVQKYQGCGGFVDSFKPTILIKNETVLNKKDTENILKAIEIARSISLPSISDLSIKLETKLNISKEDDIAIKNFISALNNLPKYINLEVSINGKLDKSNELKLNLETVIEDVVKNHFKEELYTYSHSDSCKRRTLE